ncbi:hypothetical protein Vafri_556 [Volvox africanus]|nr:hypothetical protein Vafri_556 [Volvox africanus]
MGCKLATLSSGSMPSRTVGLPTCDRLSIRRRTSGRTIDSRPGNQNPGVNPGVPETVPVSSIENLLQNTQLAQRQQQPEAAAMAAATQQPQQLQQQNDQLVQPQPQPQPQPQAQPQPEAQPQPQPTPAIVRQECADVPISTSQLELANMAELIVTGVVLAAGAGSGVCHPNGTLTPMPDDLSNSAPGGADPPQSPKRPPSNSSFVLVGLQCTHKGLVRCRNNSDDLGDCLVLVEAPVLPDSAPCALTGGQRYMFFLQV